MFELSDLEKIEDEYPNLVFYGIEVNNPKYHGHIEGNEVYINTLQPDIDWLKTALHETVHYDYDNCNLSNQEQRQTMIAEGWARRESERRYNELFGKEGN
ncbi:hypothetical protein FC35_GL000643 [Limosilactobacillus coleohominis DSM 14060]|nr:hypothetical protein FC35_GL000643 [Limosilactobacillus coleohominis DSM 14060]